MRIKRFGFLIAALGALGVTSAPAGAAGKWQYEITPYLWGSGIEGRTSSFGQVVEVDASASDLLDFVDGGWAFNFVGRGDSWSSWVDIFKVSLSHDATIPGTPVTIESNVDQTIAELGIGYSGGRTVEWIAGVRYMDMSVELAIPGIAGAEDGSDWIDPFVGARVGFPLGRKISAGLRGDVGGFGAGSDLAWNVVGSLSYQFSKSVSGKLAYRYLDVDYDDNGFLFDASLSGFGLGLSIAF
jgi:opacity protein-like surface antigen